MARLGLLDVLLWNVPPQILVGDALWFSVIAVMCRVHSLVLWILVSFEVSSLMLALGGGFVDIFAFDHAPQLKVEKGPQTAARSAMACTASDRPAFQSLKHFFEAI